MLLTTASVRRGLERHWSEKLHERPCANLLLLVWVLWKKKHSQRKTPYLQAQKSQWSSEHKELRGASAASESCLKRVLGWCRIFLGSSQRSESEVETREAHRFCRWLPGAAKSSWSCQDSKFERCFPSPLRIYAAGHPPQKRYDPRLCDTATQTGARWDGKRKDKTVSYWQLVTMWLKVWQVSSKGQLKRDGSLVNPCAWQDRAPQSAVRALLEQGAWLGTRSSSSCRTSAKSVKWINKSIAMFPETFVELVNAVESPKKGDYQLLGRCGKHRLYWYLQWILMDLHFPWRSQGFCILILMTMYGHLTKSTTLPRNLLLPSAKQQHILLNWFLSSTDIFQKCPRAPWSTNWWVHIFRNTKNIGKTI